MFPGLPPPSPGQPSPRSAAPPSPVQQSHSFSRALASGEGPSRNSTPTRPPSGMAGYVPILEKFTRHGNHASTPEEVRDYTALGWKGLHETILPMLRANLFVWGHNPSTARGIYTVDGSNVFHEFNPYEWEYKQVPDPTQPEGFRRESGLIAKKQEIAGPAIVVLKSHEFDKNVNNSVDDPDRLRTFWKWMKRLTSHNDKSMPVFIVTIDIKRPKKKGERGIKYKTEWEHRTLAPREGDACCAVEATGGLSAELRNDGSGEYYPTVQRLPGPAGVFDHLRCEWDDVAYSVIHYYLRSLRTQRMLASRDFACEHLSKDADALKDPTKVRKVEEFMAELGDAVRWNMYILAVPGSA